MATFTLFADFTILLLYMSLYKQYIRYKMLQYLNTEHWHYHKYSSTRIHLIKLLAIKWFNIPWFPVTNLIFCPWPSHIHESNVQAFKRNRLASILMILCTVRNVVPSWQYVTGIPRYREHKQPYSDTWQRFVSLSYIFTYVPFSCWFLFHFYYFHLLLRNIFIGFLLSFVFQIFSIY